MVRVGRFAAILTTTRPRRAAGVAALAGRHGADRPQAQSTVAQSPPPPVPPAAEDDGLAGGGFYLEADRLVHDDIQHTTRAEGSVEARYKGRVLRADEVDYDSVSGVVTARGHVKSRSSPTAPPNSPTPSPSTRT